MSGALSGNHGRGSGKLRDHPPSIDWPPPVLGRTYGRDSGVTGVARFPHSETGELSRTVGVLA